MNRTSSIYRKLQNTGKYNISQYSYPENLAGEIGHSIFFAINTVKGSSYDKSSKEVVSVDGISNEPSIQDRNPINNREILGEKALTRRIDSAIALYMPENITSSLDLNWENGELNAGVNLLGAYQSLEKVSNRTSDIINSESWGDLGSKIMSDFGDITNNVTNGQNYLDFGSVVLSDAEIGNTISLFNRRFRNPYMEFLFRGVSPRQFSFDFKFFPKNARETENVRNIIKLFRQSALPELQDTGGFLGSFYTYPNEFDIYLMSNSTVNKYLFKTSTCALTNISVNYAPQGQLSFHEEVPGQGNPPVAISMSLSFTELELMHRERLEEGY